MKNNAYLLYKLTLQRTHMKIKMNRKQAMELDVVFKTTNFDMPISGKFRYMVTSNLKTLEKEITEINSAFPPIEQYVEYTKKMNEVNVRFKVSTKEDVTKLEEDAKLAYEEKLIELDTIYAEAIVEQEMVNKERFAFLAEQTELELKTVKPDDVPNIAEKNQFNHWDIWNVLMLVVAE